MVVTVDGCDAVGGPRAPAVPAGGEQGTWVYAALAEPCPAAAVAALRGVNGEPLRTVGSVRPVRPLASAAPVDSGESVDCGESGESVECGDFGEPVESGGPVDPGDPGEPGGLAAVVGHVPLAAFAVTGAAEDRDRLAGIAYAHHRVLAALATMAPVVPFRLATIYRDDARVAEMLADRRSRLHAALRLVDGHREWGVKVYLDARPGPRTPVAGAGKGTEYLLRRRAERRDDEQVRRYAGACADRAHHMLATYADASSRFAAHDPWAVGGRPWVILNASYLVADGRFEAFAAELRALERHDSRLTPELTGPWPPYSVGTGVEEP